MQVKSINNQYLCKAYSEQPSFKGKNAAKIVNSSGIRHFPEVKKWYAGLYGTCCDGSVPLTDFFKNIKPELRQRLIERGLSTNIEGYGNCYLKSNWNNPISTSGIFDCSVMYLANANSESHFLYHMDKMTYYSDIIKVIKDFMPEGFTHAGIVPGDKARIADHKKYLHEVFNAIKDSNPDAVINLYHESSKLPEIVGYKGQLYEIPKMDYSKNFQNSFSIKDLRIK